MPAQKCKNGLWRFRKMVQYKWILGRCIYRTERDALAAEAITVAEYIRTGRISTIPPSGEKPSETVFDLYQRWVQWLEAHRSPRHTRDMKNLLSRALAVAPDFASVQASGLTVDQVEEWGERWAANLLERGKGRGEVNKWLRYSQTAFNPPWGRRRAQREIPNNPFQYVDRYSVVRRAKYVPTREEVYKLRMAAEPEFRLYLELLQETAARVSEARTMSWEQVGPDSVVLYTQKTARGDMVPRRLAISQDLAERLKSWRRQQPDGVLYIFQQGEKAEPRVTTWEAKAQRRTCEAAGVPYFPPSCFRHYRASLWAAEGVPLTAIQARLGHTQATTTNNYLREVVGSHGSFV